MDRPDNKGGQGEERVTSARDARTAAGTPEPFERWHPMTEEKLVSPVDDGVSPYLQQPLRTLEQAKQDCKRKQRQIGDPEAKAAQPD
jgi:hypothetical protein